MRVVIPESIAAQFDRIFILDTTWLTGCKVRIGHIGAIRPFERILMAGVRSADPDVIATGEGLNERILGR